MRNDSTRLSLLLPMLLVFALTVQVGIAAEPPAWADATLPVRDGLELWLDATRQNSAREAQRLNRLRAGDPMELWHDASGHGRHLTQWNSKAQPAWRATGVRFDGDDFLAALVTPGVEHKEGTVFIVVAPEASSGDFDGMFSASRIGESDFTSGLNVDLGSESAKGSAWRVLNVEGAGQPGVRNLLAKPLALGLGHVLAVRTAPGKTELRLDGALQGMRERNNAAWTLDRVAVGGRFIGSGIQHHFTGRIAEVLVFGRRLEDAQVAKVEAWLAGKHAAFLRPPDPNAPQEVTLVPARDAPVVQMLVPGFTVRELPVRVTALNNVEYAPDGRLFAGGYDGRFHLLRDTDADGLEDKLDTFSPATTDDYPLGMVVKNGMPHALLANEIVRFRDTNGDGVPDVRETVLKGWDDPNLTKPDHRPKLHARRVDSGMGLAAGPDDSWYVTMGSAAYDNGYWHEGGAGKGRANYSPDKRKGCLLRLWPDGRVEQINTGLRYVMSLQWNQHGDLFGTDQEGATWLPNGNPFDELLHLQKGRHYGFPPRHPKWLPNVVDEPSVWDFAPQHQSTCGFRFNGPTEGRARFGPAHWAHNAFTTGESRGKVWRTALAKTAAGYVARTELIATLALLAVDCALSPTGDLVVVGHTGTPDWGRGPSANGRVFKISYTALDAPQPVLAWAESDIRTVVEFDRPLDPAEWTDLKSRTRIEFGRYVSAADRLEVIRPGYAVVRMEESEPRYALPVKSVTLARDARSLVIETPPRLQGVNYALTIDLPRRSATNTSQSIAQLSASDLAHDLTGLAAEWRGHGGAAWTGWVPHADFATAREFTRASAAHDDLWKRVATSGKLTLRAQLDLANMLQPAVQPGSKLDDEPEPEVVTVTFKSDASLTLEAPGASVARVSDSEARLTLTSRAKTWQPFTLSVTTPARSLDVSFTTALDSRPRPLGTRKTLLPFAIPAGATAKERVIPEIAGGNWENGHALFKGKAACFTCHQIRGEGFAAGPDLSNTPHRDYASVLRDIRDPNAALNPDAIAYTVTLKNSDAFTGVRAGETDEELKLATPGGFITTLKKSDIARREANQLSMMPAGLLDTLTPQEVKDLMTFLMTEPRSGR